MIALCGRRWRFVLILGIGVLVDAQLSLLPERAFGWLALLLIAVRVVEDAQQV